MTISESLYNDEEDSQSETLLNEETRQVLSDLKRYLEAGPIKTKSDRVWCLSRIDSVAKYWNI
jgi:hypothetical protein